MFTWPAYKLCEPHAVLLWMTALAMIAVLNASFWTNCWQVAALGMALLAPFLASARIARAVTRGAAEAEFDRWFQPAEVGRAPLLPSARGGRVPTNR